MNRTSSIMLTTGENRVPRRSCLARLSLLTLLVVLAWGCNSNAAVGVTAATGGTNISADNAANATSPAYTPLGDIVIAETAGTDFAASQTNETLILTVPTGWSFKASTGTVSSPSGEITATAIAVTTSAITVTLSTNAGTTNLDTLTISGIQVRADDGGNVSGSGNIQRTSGNPGTATIAGITNDSTNFGSLSQAVGAMSKLVVTLPGQTFTDAATTAGSGNSGTVTAQTAGTSFNISFLTATDQFFNIVTSYGGAKTISYSGPGGNPTYTTAVSFTSGQSTTTLATTLTKAETTTITAGDGTTTGPASSSLTVNAGSFSKLQLLVPGETANPGSATGKTGSPSAQVAGIAFNVTVNSVDGNWNAVSSTDTVGITSTDSHATLPATAALSGGTQTFSVNLKTAGTATLTASDITTPGNTPDTSPSITVNAGTFTKLQLLVPGETADPGSATGKTGSPSAQSVGTAFTITVNAVDANWNLKNSATDTVHIASNDPKAVLPSNAALVAGTKDFNVTLKSSGNRTITASDVTNGSITSATSPVVVVANNAPVLTPIAPTLTTITEDETNPAGSLISTIVGSSITDADTAAEEGIAITTVAGTHGAWQYSLDNGSNWTPIGTVTNTSALLLRDVDMVRFVPDAQDGTTATITYRAWDQTSGTEGTKVDVSTNGSGTAFSTATDTATLTVNAINDGPVNTVPGAQTATEGTPLVFSSGNSNLISFSDVDAGSSTGVNLTLTVGGGKLTLSQTTGLSFTQGDGTADATIECTGTVANLNAALAGMSYSSDAGFGGTETLTIKAGDNGATGSGGGKFDQDTVTISVTGINDAPVNTVPGTQTMNENTMLVFSTANSNLISIADPDSGAGSLQVTLSVTTGTLSLSGTTGLTFTVGDGTADTTMTFTGTLASTNTALSGLGYSPPANSGNASATLTLTANDQGNTGTGGAKSDTDTVTININAVNDPPVNTVPGAQSTSEDTALVFTGGNAVSMTDFEAVAGSKTVEATLTATNGTVTLGNAGVVSITGGANGSGTVTFQGTVSNINTALNNTSFSPTSNFNGSATLTITSSDLGWTAPGGGQGTPLTDTDSVTITVTAVNDAPANTVPGAAQNTNEDTSLTFSSGGGNQISVSDVDAGSGAVKVTLTASNGTVSLNGNAGLSFLAGDGLDDDISSFTGTIADINTALNGMTFTPSANFSGVASLQVVTDDQGYTGSGGSKQSPTDTVTINVTGTNDPPVNSVPGAQTGGENATLVFSTANSNLISISDPDAGNTPVQVKLTATNGIVTLSGTTGLTITAGGNGTATVTFTGSIDNINVALAGMGFLPTTNYTGPASVQIQTDDLGATGAGPNGTDDDTVNITVSPVNDPPVNNMPVVSAINEDASATFTISVSDPDADPNELQVTLTTTNGTVTLGGIAGLTFSAGDGTTDATMTFTGTRAAINTAMTGMTYDPTLNFNGSGTVEITTDDLGHNGAGGSKSDTDSLSITVNGVNDAPVNSVPGAQTAAEDTAFAFSSANGNLISISDPDAGTDPVQVTLTASNGTVSLSGTTNLIVTGNGTGTVNITGAISDINASLAGMTFTGTANYSGPGSLTILTNDNGKNGSGGALSDTDIVNITISAVNNAPVNTVPPTQSTNENTAKTLSAANGNALSINDVDVGGGNLNVTLTTTTGTLNLLSTTGLIVTGNGTASVSLAGSMTDLNNAFGAGLAYSPSAGFSGDTTIQISTSDNGLTGSGGAKTDTDTVTVTVIGVNDPPVNTIPGAQTTNEDTPKAFSSANSNAISVADPDAGSNSIQVTLNGTNGTATLSGRTGRMTFTTGDGNDDVQMVFTGTLADINEELEGLSFTPSANFSGAASLQIITDDQGHAGTGGAKTDTDSIAVTISAVNDAPVNSVPGPQTATENVSKVFSGGSLVSVSDVEAFAGNLPLQVTLTATNGTLTLNGVVGLTFTTGNGVANVTMTFTGLQAAINTALNGISYNPSLGFNGAASLTITTDDQDAGGAKSDTDAVSISVDPVNDPPTISDITDKTIGEDGNTTALALTIGDAESPPDNLGLTGTSSNLTLVPNANIVFGGSGANRTVTVMPAANQSGTATITVTVSDGEFTATDTFLLTVNAVNDLPTISDITDQATNEDSATPAVPFTVNDVETAAASLIVTGVSTNTTLVPNGSIAFGGSGASRTVTMTPAADQSGTTTITITVSDGSLTASDSFVLKVNAVNDAPTISNIADQTVTEGTVVGPLPFTVGDNETAAGSLTFFTDSSNTLIVPNANVSLGGSAASRTITVAPVGGESGTTTITVTVSDGSKTASDTFDVTVTAVNNAPTIADIPDQTVNEDSALVFSADNGNLVSIADSDAGSNPVKVMLATTDGTLTLSGLAGLTMIVGDGSDDTALAFTGTISDINTAIAGMSFLPSANFNGTATLQVTIDDQGNTGSGGSLTATDTTSITVSAVNDAPVNTIPGAQTVGEDTALVFSVANGNAISTSDVDAGSAAVEVTLTAANGTLTLGSVAGLTFTSGDGVADATTTFTGTVASINTALNGMSFTSDANYNGTASVQIKTDDQGNTGSGGARTDIDTVAITVTNSNDPPVNALPAAQSVDEEGTLTFSFAGNNLITISDTDSGANPVKVILIAADGKLTLSGTSGLSFTVGDGNDDSVMTFTGTINDINTALTGMVYTPVATFTGATTLTITTDDQGNTGEGGSKTDTDALAINVSALNDAPINTVPPAQSVAEDTPLIFLSANGNAISVADDAGNNPIKVALAATHGTLTLSGTAGLTFSNGDGTADASMTFTGTLAVTNAALNGLAFIPAADYSGGASVEITTDDQGNTGVGSPLTDTDTITITVGEVNDAPVNSVSAPQNTDEDTTLVFSSAAGNPIVISDDASDNPIRVTLTATNGSLTLGGTSGLTFAVGSGTADGTMTFTGSLEHINSALNGMSFIPNTSFNGNAGIQVSTDDQGNSGTGGAKTDSDAVTITVNAVNDAPVNNVPAPQTTNENADLVFSAGNGNAVSVIDVDAGNGVIQISLTATNGPLTLFGSAGLSFTTGDGVSDTTMTFTGTLTNINAALNGLRFTPLPDVNGSASVQIVSSDQGNTGSGGARSDTDTVPITIGAVNNPPVNGIPAAQTINEDTNLVFSHASGNAITISDVDAGGASVQVTLNPTNGALTLSSTAGLTFTVGDGVSDNPMTFTGTLAAINAALDGLLFTPTQDFSGATSIEVVTDDRGNTGSGGAKTDTDAVTITVNAVNDAPVISLSPGTLIYIEGSGQAVIDPQAKAADVDSPDLDAGTLTVDFASGGTSDDRLTVKPGGSIGIVGNSVTYIGGTIGTFVGGGDGTTPLVVSLNVNATVDATQALMRSIAFENVSQQPSGADRTVRFVLTDGDGGTSNAATRTISVESIQADLLIKPSTEPDAAFSSDNVYQMTPADAQIENQPVRPETTATYQIKVENDGNTNRSFVVKVMETSDSGWTTNYKAYFADISVQITGASGYVTKTLAPNASEIITLEVTPGSGLIGGNNRSATLKVFLDGRDATLQDTVQAVTTLCRPELLVKRGAEVEAQYGINDVYQTVPAGAQIESLTVNPNTVAAYDVKVENDGNTTRTYTVKVNESFETGWTVVYKVGSDDISAAVRGAGYTTSALTPGGNEVITVEMTPDSKVANNTSKNTILKVFYEESDTVIRDSVKIETSVSKSPAPTVTGLAPNSGFNNGPVNITNLAGTGFDRGATAKLSRVGETDIVATKVSVASSTKITCTFDLTGKTIGSWNVVVINGDGQEGVLVSGFTINDASTLVRDVALTALTATPNPVSRGKTVTFTYAVKNNGNVTETGLTFRLSYNGRTLGKPQTLPALTAGQQTTGSIRLTIPSTTRPGDYLITGEVSPVPGETNTANNTMTVKVTVK